MGDDFFCVLAAALPLPSSSLKELWLNKNDLHDEGLTSLASVLPRLPLMESLDLRYNRFTDHDIVLLSQALTQLPHLQEFQLNQLHGSEFSAAATAALASALTSSYLAHSLRYLVLSLFASGSQLVAVLLRLESLNYLGFLSCDLSLSDIEVLVHCIVSESACTLT